MIFLSSIEPYLSRPVHSFLNYLRAHRPAAIKAHKKSIEDFSHKVTEINTHGLELLVESDYPTVLNGPFRGLTYLSESSGSALLPKIIGSYEEPIYHIIDEIVSSNLYDFIVDVGCAEGFYAVGFAKFVPKARIVAYDINSQAISLAKQLAELNAVSKKVSFRSEFTVSELANFTSSGDVSLNTLLFMDVEGAELSLLNPSLNCYLPLLDILVELHDCFHSGLTDLILDYLGKTHSCHFLQDYPWCSHDYSLPETVVKSPHMHLFFDEFRPSGKRWLYAKRRPY